MAGAMPTGGAAGSGGRAGAIPTGGAAGSGGAPAVDGGASPACTFVSNVTSCTNGSIAEINLGPLDSTTCRDQCSIELARVKVTAGCWVSANNGNCYCRNGVLNLGGDALGGSCTLAVGP